jgi:tetratricopeptide (TPR) repeat protein
MIAIAALIVPLLLAQAESAQAVHAARYAQCVALIDTDPEAAYEEGMAWASEGHVLSAYRCAALALIAQDRHDEGARRLESLATALNPDQASLRAELLSQSANAWLLAREPSRARSALTRAIATMAPGAEQLPDMRIDRARAYAMEGDFRAAEEDLSAALDLRPNDPLALRLRATARMNQRAFQLAEADALQALTLATNEDDRVDAALVLGHVRESIRTGAPVEAQ